MTKRSGCSAPVPSFPVIDACCKAAAAGDDRAVLWYLEQYPLFASVSGSDGRTPLMSAAWNCQEKIIDILIAHGVDAAQQDKRGWTALMLAAWRGSQTIVEKLVAFKSTIDLQSHEGLTALMLAANMGHSHAVSALLAARVNPDLRDASGRTAADMAFDRGFHMPVRMIELYKDARAEEERKYVLAKMIRDKRLRDKRPGTPFNKKGPKL